MGYSKRAACIIILMLIGWQETKLKTQRVHPASPHQPLNTVCHSNRNLNPREVDFGCLESTTWPRKERCCRHTSTSPSPSPAASLISRLPATTTRIRATWSLAFLSLPKMQSCWSARETSASPGPWSSTTTVKTSPPLSWNQLFQTSLPSIHRSRTTYVSSRPRAGRSCTASTPRIWAPGQRKQATSPREFTTELVRRRAFFIQLLLQRPDAPG